MAVGRTGEVRLAGTSLVSPSSDELEEELDELDELEELGSLDVRLDLLGGCLDFPPAEEDRLVDEDRLYEEDVGCF